MKILLISYFFPPFNIIGAVRVSKLAEYWLSKGHDVIVLSAKSQPLLANLYSKFPENRVIYTDWFNINSFPEKVMGGRSAVSSRGFDTKNSFLKSLGSLYKNIFNIPDGQIGWYPFAVKAADELISNGWKPDLIYASAHPLTSLLVSSRIAKKFSIPWVAEYRDLWTDNHNYKHPFWRRWIDLLMERRVMLSSSALVTVSEPLASVLRKKTLKPIAVVMNGFDPNDYLDVKINLFPENKLNIVYTGMVYRGKQDPSALFEALSKHPQRDFLKVHFFGRYLEYINILAKNYMVEDIVDVFEPVSFKESVAIQKAADVLLFLTWNDSDNNGVLTGKIFEYFGAKHPILAIGSQVGLAGNMILERGAGLVTNDVFEIKEQLTKWVLAKKKSAIEFELHEDVNKGLSRFEQFEKLDSYLIDNSLMKNVK
jgi:hypothetical protein